MYFMSLWSGHGVGLRYISSDCFGIVLFQSHCYSDNQHFLSGPRWPALDQHGPGAFHCLHAVAGTFRPSEVSSMYMYISSWRVQMCTGRTRGRSYNRQVCDMPARRSSSRAAFYIIPRPQCGGHYAMITIFCLSVRLSVICLTLTRERKGIAIWNLTERNCP